MRVRLLRFLQLAARGDVFWEQRGDLAIFYPDRMSWLASGTATLDFTGLPGLLLRLEYRHDHSDSEIFFARPDASALFSGRDIGKELQDTLTVGAVVWF